MTARFLTLLNTTRLPDGFSHVEQELVFESEILGRKVRVPPGFKTDFASVPRLPLTYLLFGGVGDAAAVIHDYLYTMGNVPRKVCDEVFAEALAASDVPAWRRGPMWLGVRLFGGGRYTPAAS